MDSKMPFGRTIKVLLADDHAMVRQALAGVLEQSGEMQVVTQASTGEEALQGLQQFAVDVVVLDYAMPGSSAPQVVASMLRGHPRVRILVLTVHESPHYAVKVLESGAHGFLIKSAAVEELVDAIKKVYEGEMYLSATLSSEILHLLRKPRRARAGLEGLSEREFDLVRHLAAGLTLQDSARAMNVSTSTASTYRARALEKLDLDSTGELIRYAIENHILD